MKASSVITIILNIIGVLVGLYAFFAASSLEGINTSLPKQDAEGAYLFFGGVLAIVAVWNLVISIRNRKKV